MVTFWKTAARTPNAGVYLGQVKKHIRALQDK